jgi:hypothetical protein
MLVPGLVDVPAGLALTTTMAAATRVRHMAPGARSANDSRRTATPATLRAMRLHKLFVPGALLAFSVAARPAAGQADDRAAILATVQKVFDAMRTRDSTLLLSAFDSTGRLVRVSGRGGTPSVGQVPPRQFFASVNSAPAGEVWNERIYDPEVRIDGNVAQVWAYYTFHRNSTFSHCGVDAFMLVKVGSTWKITQIADSSRREGCTHTEPPAK